MVNDVKVLYPLIGGSRAQWEAFIENARLVGAERKRKMALLQKWHTTLIDTTTEIEWAFGLLAALTEQEAAAARSKQRTIRRSKTQETLRDFLMRPSDLTDKPLRELRLCSKSGAEMRLDCLSFEGSGSGFIVGTNQARELFQAGLVPKALFGLYYIRNGERSAGHGWEKPFLDEVFVLP